MSRPRRAAAAALLLCGGGLIVLLSLQRSRPPLRSSLAPAFQTLGEGARSVGVATAKLLPIDDLDEKEYGDLFAASYEFRSVFNSKDSMYLKALLDGIASASSKPFRYRVFILEEYEPNALAVAGGVILVTKGLLRAMKTEGQLVAVMAHEMGHIECGHCFNAVRFELLARKINIPDVGEVADYLNHLFFSHSFSKTEEAEADAFAYKVILGTTYSPSSLAAAFNELLLHDRAQQEPDEAADSVDILRDYVASHPPLRLREAKYAAEARRWWSAHAGLPRYNGRRNLSERVPMSTRMWDDEWSVSPPEL